MAHQLKMTDSSMRSSCDAVEETRPLTGSRAHLEGFYDESHFDREFRHSMGTSPLGRVNGDSRFATTITDHLFEAE